MNKFLTGFIFSLIGATALAGTEPGPPGMPPNLAVDIQAPGAVRMRKAPGRTVRSSSNRVA